MNPGWLNGPAPEAVARRGERIWTRLDKVHRVFLISVNDYGDMTDAAKAMTAALDARQADRVVFDMRYLQGGNGDIAILDTLRDDPRINRAGRPHRAHRPRERLRRDIGRRGPGLEDERAVFVGEPTPARADNFRCDCHDFVLPHSGFTLSVPTWWDRLGDDRPEIAPDVPMALSSTDFFAGRDPVLDAALSGRLSGA